MGLELSRALLSWSPWTVARSTFNLVELHEVWALHIALMTAGKLGAAYIHKESTIIQKITIMTNNTAYYGALPNQQFYACQQMQIDKSGMEYKGALARYNAFSAFI